MKDIYMLDFLGITEPTIERKIESRMIEAIKELLLELGYGFAFLKIRSEIISRSDLIQCPTLQ